MKSLAKALRILDQFTVARPHLSLTELSQACDIPLSTVHRIAKDLKTHGFLVQDPHTKRFRLGFAAIELGHRAIASLEVPTVANPVMVRLVRETGETVLLTMPNESRDRSVCVGRVDGQHDLRIHLPIGKQVPLHAGASAKVLLAYFPPHEVDELIRREGLPKVAPRTIIDPALLKEELARIRERGYAFSMEETNEGAWGVAVPILDERDTVVASVGISVPASRYDPEAEDEYVELTREAAEEIATLMGMRHRQNDVPMARSVE